jgi:hypothetical protein
MKEGKKLAEQTKQKYMSKRGIVTENETDEPKT